MFVYLCLLCAGRLCIWVNTSVQNPPLNDCCLFLLTTPSLLHVLSSLCLFHSCSDFQVPGRSVARVLPGDTWEEPLSRHAVVSALLWDVQGLLCPKAAAEELTSGRLAGQQLFAITLFINTHTSMFFRPNIIRLHII